MHLRSASHLPLIVHEAPSASFKLSGTSQSLDWHGWRHKISMTQPREHIFSPCSARASGASARNTGMPLEAHLTAREADERTVNSSLCEQFSLSSAVESNPFPISKRLEMSLPQDKDPFVTPVRGTRLSPTASTFTPGTESNTVLSLDDVVYSSNALSSELGLSRVLRISSNEAIAVSEIEEWLSVSGFAPKS